MAFSACKDKTVAPPPVDPDDATVQTPADADLDDENAAIDYEADLSTERYDGYEFRMLVRTIEE